MPRQYHITSILGVQTYAYAKFMVLKKYIERSRRNRRPCHKYVVNLSPQRSIQGWGQGEDMATKPTNMHYYYTGTQYTGDLVIYVTVYIVILVLLQF